MLVTWAINLRNVKKLERLWMLNFIILILVCSICMQNVFIRKLVILRIRNILDYLMEKYHLIKIMLYVKICMEYSSFLIKVLFKLHYMLSLKDFNLAVIKLLRIMLCFKMLAIGSILSSWRKNLEFGLLKEMLIIVYLSPVPWLGSPDWEIIMELKCLISGDNGGCLDYTNMRIR